MTIEKHQAQKRENGEGEAGGVTNLFSRWERIKEARHKSGSG